VKKSDWALVILIVAIAGIASYFTANALLPAPNKNPQTVPTAEKITSEVTEPSDKIFNEDAINPTVRITIGGDQKSQTPPFTLGEN
jgi:hypothetical protein